MCIAAYSEESRVIFMYICCDFNMHDLVACCGALRRFGCNVLVAWY